LAPGNDARAIGDISSNTNRQPSSKGGHSTGHSQKIGTSSQSRQRLPKHVNEMRAAHGTNANDDDN